MVKLLGLLFGMLSEHKNWQFEPAGVRKLSAKQFSMPIKKKIPKIWGGGPRFRSGGVKQFLGGGHPLYYPYAHVWVARSASQVAVVVVGRGSQLTRSPLCSVSKEHLWLPSLCSSLLYHFSWAESPTQKNVKKPLRSSYYHANHIMLRNLFTFVYICLHLFTFVYICLHLFTTFRELNLPLKRM
jgi:hypothetical protein